MRRMPSLGRAGAWLVLASVMAGGCAEELAPASGLIAGYSVGPCTTPAGEEELANRVIQLINEERARAGLGPVQPNEQLTRAAQEYACRMIEAGFFAHVDPITGEEPKHRVTSAGYAWRGLGENLAAGQQSPEQVVRDWMNSTNGHRENILMPDWQDVGVGVRMGGEYGVYWVLEFGNPAPDAESLASLN